MRQTQEHVGTLVAVIFLRMPRLYLTCLALTAQTLSWSVHMTCMCKAHERRQDTNGDQDACSC